MGTVLRRIWADPVWSKVISTVIIAVPGSAALWAGWTTFLTWINACIAFLGNATAVPNWLLAIGVILSLIALGSGFLLAAIALRGAVNPSPNTYRRDYFIGMVWRWRYGIDNRVYDIVPFCPHCDFQIIPRRANAYQAVDCLVFECEHCGRFNTTINESWDDIERQVERRIHLKLRNGEWASAVQKTAS